MPDVYKRQGFGFAFGFFGRNHHRCGHFVTFFEVEQLDALRRAAGRADRSRVDADDLAVLADDDQLGSLIDQLDADHFAVARRGLDVDHAFAAARLESVLLDVGAFAEAGFGDAEDAGDVAIGFCRDREADDVVIFADVDAAHAVRGTAHGADVFFSEADGHAVVRGEEDDLVAVGDANADQLVVLVDANGDDAARHDVAEVLERRLLDGAFARGEEDVLAFLFEVADGQDVAHGLAGLQAEQAGDGFALAQMCIRDRAEGL